MVVLFLRLYYNAKRHIDTDNDTNHRYFVISASRNYVAIEGAFVYFARKKYCADKKPFYSL